MSPPGPLAAPLPGGTTTGRQALTASQLELMTRAAHKALVDCDVVIGPSKVSRLVRKFAKAVSRQGLTFHEFLTNEAHLSPVQQRRIVGHPEWARVIAYSDPTGEAAVSNVLRAQGGRQARIA